DLAEFRINSVYFNETCIDSLCDLAIRYSLVPNMIKQIVITSILTVGASNVTKTIVINPQFNYTTIQLSNPNPIVSLVSIPPTKSKQQFIPNILTPLKLTLTLKSNTIQTINLRLYPPGVYQEFLFVKPIILSQSSSLTYTNMSIEVIGTVIHLNVEKAYFEGIQTDQTFSSVNQINCFMQLYTATSATPVVNFNYNLTLNSVSLLGTFMFASG
ncbi:unnamed protein product, partial [Schistosoma turkestanicum]